MSDRPEITAKADGANIVVIMTERVDPMFLGKIGWIKSATLSPQECFALQCQLSAARVQAINNHIEEVSVVVPAEPKINFREWT